MTAPRKAAVAAPKAVKVEVKAEDKAEVKEELEVEKLVDEVLEAPKHKGPRHHRELTPEEQALVREGKM